MTQRGFTMVEMIVAMVVLGIIAGMVAVFIRMPVLGYRDAVNRAELTDTADLALRRMARDIRLALPNSIGTINNGLGIQFLITKTGGRYQAAEDNISGGNVLDFYNAANRSFNVLGAMPSAKQAIAAGDFIVVYNLGIAPASAYAGGNVAQVAGVAGNVVTLTANPFAAQNPPMPSPSARFFVVTGGVWYVCTPGAGGTGTLTRYWTTTIPAVGTPPANAQHAVIANNVVTCNFSANTVQTRNTSLVVLNLSLNKTTSADPDVTLTHQIHVDNTP